MDGLKNHFNISWLSMLLIAVVVPVLVGRWPAYIAIMAGVIAGSLLSIVLQGALIADVVDTLYNGYHIQSGVAALDKLLNRGGMSTMYSLATLFCSWRAWRSTRRFWSNQRDSRHVDSSI